MQIEVNPRVAIQGSKGAFHQMAANKYFSKDIKIVPCTTFDDIVEALSNKQVEYGLMAIENSVAGSLMPNYSLLKEADIKIVGEEYLHIEQNLMALPGQTIDDIKEVHSHYMAIAQTRKFFNNYPHIKLVEASDTAVVAENIQKNKLQGIGAIASELASKIYGLEILSGGIETHKKNFTRFLVLTHEHHELNIAKNSISKASICFSLPHEKGSLSAILSILAIYDLNLTKIQSLPIIGQTFQYFFYVDVIFKDHTNFQNGLLAITPLVNDLQELGKYKHAIQSFNTIHKQ